MDKLMKREPILYYISFIYSHSNIKESYNRHIDRFSQESMENLFDFEFNSVVHKRQISIKLSIIELYHFYLSFFV
jgi:hypothetical protein